MPRFILICESTRHACYASEDEIRRWVDIRSNPGGYTDVDQCMAMITSPEGAFTAFPLTGPMGQMSIHVEGRMDFANTLIWREPGHRCDLACLVAPQRSSRRVANPELRGNER